MRAIRDLLNITRARDRTRAAICSVIKSRRIMEFFYHGGYRRVEPFCLGLVMSGEADNESLLCYQIGGYSELREVVGWKLYRASEMEDIEIFREQFGGDRPGYDPDSVDMVTIYCCVTPETDAEVRGRETLKVEPLSGYEKSQKPVTRMLTHNELMRRFRFTHPIPIPELYTYIFSGPWLKPLPGRTESKITPLMRVFDRFHLWARQAG